MSNSSDRPIPDILRDLARPIDCTWHRSDPPSGVATRESSAPPLEDSRQLSTPAQQEHRSVEAGLTGDHSDALADLARCYKKAILEYWNVLSRHRKLTGESDRVIYEKLCEELEHGEEVPCFDTWGRYVREARRRLGMSKNKPRGVPEGRSIVPLKRL